MKHTTRPHPGIGVDPLTAYSFAAAQEGETIKSMVSRALIALEAAAPLADGYPRSAKRIEESITELCAFLDLDADS